MTIEIEEVTVKDGIVRITALNCSEENLQKLETAFLTVDIFFVSVNSLQYS